MKLDQALNRKEYYTLSTLRENSNRVKFLSLHEEKIEKIKKRLFDEYDVENVYMTGEILEKKKFSVNTLSLFFEMDKSDFERFVDSHEIKKNMFKGLKVFIKSEGIVYTYNSKWGETDMSEPVLLI